MGGDGEAERGGLLIEASDAAVRGAGAGHVDAREVVVSVAALDHVVALAPVVAGRAVLAGAVAGGEFTEFAGLDGVLALGGVHDDEHVHLIG